jgi:hypothetical protein
MESQALRRRQFLVGSLSLAGLLLPRTALAAEPLVVVVGPGSHLRDVKTAELRRVFLNRPTTSDDGERYIPLNHTKDLWTRARFDRTVLQMDPDEVQRYWVDQKIRGVPPPRTIPIDAIAQVLEKVPGAISYLPLSLVGKLYGLSIDGLAPSSPSYPLR